MADEVKAPKTTRRRRKTVEETAVEPVVKETGTINVTAETTAERLVKEVDLEVELLKQQNELMKAQLEALKAQIANAQPQVIQISPDTERVEFLWLAPVADENELLIAGGLYGKITGKVGNFFVPKNELSRMLDAEMRKYIENRWLIVLGGLDEKERMMYGVDYKYGEVLDKEIFMRLLDMGKDLIDVYEKLCSASKEVVAKLYYEAWTDPARKRKINRATVVAMNKIEPQKGFKSIITGMNEEDIKD